LDCIQLTRTLIDIPSVTGHEEKVGDFLKGYLRAAGFEIESQPVADGRFNVFASCGVPEIVLSTHMDTVPPFFPSYEDEERIYGRGACDAKGILAAQICAGVRLLEEGETNFALLFVVGEERGSEGAIAANLIENASRFLVNGEPTDNCLATGTKGVYRAEVKVQGHTAHAAYPEMGVSAIHRMIDFIQKLRTHDWPSDIALGNTVYNTGTVKGGVTGNVVPDWAEAEIMFRTVESVEKMSARLKALAGEGIEILPLYTCDPVKLETLPGFETKAVSFATDISSLTHWGRPLLLGPGSILHAHTAEEQIEKQQLLQAVEHYITIVKALKKSP